MTVLKLDQTLADLCSVFTRTGTLEWIGLRPGKKLGMAVVNEADLIRGEGISGDHYSINNYSGKRQVTLIQAEHLPVIAALCGLQSINPSCLRRNLLISGINLAALKDKQFCIGTVLLEGTGYCHPCSRMEQNLGPGGFNAVRNHGGITAMVLKSGKITTGDTVSLAE